MGESPGVRNPGSDAAAPARDCDARMASETDIEPPCSSVFGAGYRARR